MTNAFELFTSSIIKCRWSLGSPTTESKCNGLLEVLQQRANAIKLPDIEKLSNNANKTICYKEKQDTCTYLSIKESIKTISPGAISSARDPQAVVTMR